MRALVQLMRDGRLVLADGPVLKWRLHGQTGNSQRLMSTFRVHQSHMFRERYSEVHLVA